MSSCENTLIACLSSKIYSSPPYRSKWSSLSLSIILPPPSRNTGLRVTRITDGGQRIVLTGMTTNAGLLGPSSRHPGRCIRLGRQHLLSLVNLERSVYRTVAWKSITDRPIILRQTAVVMLEFLRMTYNRAQTPTVLTNYCGLSSTTVTLIFEITWTLSADTEKLCKRGII